ncbi:MAG: asparagine synthase (glutamine-hydrolyzing) [Hyphomicrobiaceae bacterium]
MCGIAGLLDPNARFDAAALPRIAGAMADALRHRGPDEGNTWADEAAGLAFGHRRLSILDLSPAGRQPMLSADGRLAICYNGEIYNADALKALEQMAGLKLRGHSDTEVLLEAAAVLGVEAALRLSVGMFALAIFERETRRLWLARDRLGKKPLYWTLVDGVLLFASELKAFKAVPGFQPDIDRAALAGYVRHGYYLHPRTVFRNVQQLEPGHLLLFEPGKPPRSEPYWSLAEAVRRGRDEGRHASEREVVDRLEALLADAVSRRMVADVPLGAFLSGGYDSSTVVALMQRASSRPVRTFSIGSADKAYDEASFARAVAQHLGTDHTELVVTAKEALDVVPRLPQIYDEPFADSSAIPTYLVSALARRSVKVALSGDGGDELFAGYNRYVLGATFRDRWLKVPLPMRRVTARLMASQPPARWDHLAMLVPARLRPRLPGDKIHKLARVLGEEGDGFHVKLASLWPEPLAVIGSDCEPMTVMTDPSVAETVPDFIERMLYRDALAYLPGDILTKVDRASMAVSLEARTPLLDHRVVEFAWSLPMSMKLRPGAPKWALRQVLYRHVPPSLVDRAKAGFGVPLGDWLRGLLRDWAEDLLSERRLADGGLFSSRVVRSLWSDHLAGRTNGEHALWTILMFEAWRAHHA